MMVESSFPSRGRSRPPLPWPLPPVVSGGALAVLLLPAVAGGARALAPGAGAGPVALALAVFVAVSGAMLLGLRVSYPHARLGACNGVTLLRAGMISVLAAALLLPQRLDETGLAWALAGIALIALILDGVDGWAARRARLTSRFGARFDMEVDVSFALILALLVWQAGSVGIWVLALGLLHPAFLLLSLVWPALRAPLPEARWRKALCVVQMLALIALITPALPPALAPWLAGTVLGVLAAGFGRDILWLSRHGR